MKRYGKDEIGSSYEIAYKNFVKMKRLVAKMLCDDGFVVDISDIKNLKEFNLIVYGEFYDSGLNMSNFRFPAIIMELKKKNLVWKRGKIYEVVDIE